MKISEAIRKGAIYPQHEGALFEFGEQGIVGICAIGAAYIGYFGEIERNSYHGKTSGIYYQQILRAAGYDQDTEPEVGHPANSKVMEMYLTSVIWSLNDSYHWSFDQIATWLESIGY